MVNNREVALKVTLEVKKSGCTKRPHEKPKKTPKDTQVDLHALAKLVVQDAVLAVSTKICEGLSLNMFNFDEKMCWY